MAPLHRIVLSTDSLRQFIDAANLGMDVLGSNLPAQWAKEKKAFLCNVQHWRQKGNKRPRGENDNEKIDLAGVLLNEDGCFALKGPVDAPVNTFAWFQDARPLLPGCSCLTCKTHSRDYLYHLVLTKELLAEILLFIHNLHHLLLLCRELSDALEQGDEQTLLDHVMSQLPN